jgi:CHAD domain-containing protein
MISPKMPAREVILKVLTRLLACARRNELGIIQDEDADFLHKYRVRLRKTRSLLSSFNDVFPDAKTMEWRKKLGDFSRATNPLRDLDVFFLSRETLQEFLPISLRPGLDVFLEKLSKARRKEALKVAALVKSASYNAVATRLETQWREALTLDASAASDLPISKVAGKAITKCFCRIRKNYTQLDIQSPDETVHTLRIECKKMRYLLESFGRLFSNRDLERINLQLAKLQNRLGRYNDISIQQVYLLEFSKKMTRNRNDRLTLTLGCLIGGLHHEQAILKKKLLDSLEDFCRCENARLTKALAK